MSAGFRAVQWNRHKYVYDLVLILAIALYLAGFLWLAPALMSPVTPITPEILRIRALGSCAFGMLTLILAIGPLARLDARFLPLLYNRRHFGVVTALVALAHAATALDWYEGAGARAPLEALFASNPNYTSFVGFPFEMLGLLALVILVVMAATSHDFWLAYLTPSVWKAVHMSVYLAFALLVGHVALGVMQSDRSPIIPLLLGTAILGVSLLHRAARARTRSADADRARAEPDGWLHVDTIEGLRTDLLDGRARLVVPATGERIAIFRAGSRYSALSDLCAHQNGPLSEGLVIDGCVTCPWHGFQFRLEDGCAPAPYTDKIATYRLRRHGDAVQVDPRPLAPGTRVAPLDLGAIDG